MDDGDSVGHDLTTDSTRLFASVDLAPVPVSVAEPNAFSDAHMSDVIVSPALLGSMEISSDFPPVGAKDGDVEGFSGCSISVFGIRNWTVAIAPRAQDTP